MIVAGLQLKAAIVVVAASVTAALATTVGPAIAAGIDETPAPSVTATADPAAISPSAGIGPVAAPLTTTRTSGTDRYSTAVAISKATYATGAKTVFVVNGSGYADALSAAPAAAGAKAPLLLVARNSLPGSVRTELTRLRPSKIVVVGGSAAVAAPVVSALKRIATVQVLAGADRFATSRLVVSSFFTPGSAATAFVATGNTYPDALTASAAAGSIGAPVVLVPGTATSLDSATTSLLRKLRVSTVKIVGGTAAVSAPIASQLTRVPGVTTVERLAGADRYATSAAINADVFLWATKARFATGTGFADALAGAAAAGAQSTPLYTVPPGCVPAVVTADLDRLAVEKVELLGGGSALTPAVAGLHRC